MKYLLDTHTFLWFTADAPELSAKAKSLILDESVEIFLSTASFWETAIKNSLGKMHLESAYEELLNVARKNDFGIIGIEFDHTKIVNQLPFHHKDPFDRMIIAQALFENMDVIGIDEKFDAYFKGTGIKRIW